MNLEEQDLFDEYLDNINLNEDLQNFYEFINNDELTESFLDEINLTNLRNENYKRYNDFKILEIENLSEDFLDITNEIKKIYEFINPSDLLTNTKEQAIDSKKIIESLYKNYNMLKDIVSKDVKKLEKENDIRQKKIKMFDYNSLEETTLAIFLKKYNDLILYTIKTEEDVFENYKRQTIRRKYINDLYRIINIEIDNFNSIDNKLVELNLEIEKEILKIKEKIYYLEDLMKEDSKYQQDFICFKDYLLKLIAYDDTVYNDINRVYGVLKNDDRIKILIDNFEDLFIEEIEQERKEETFIFEKQGIKNIKISLDYITANYLAELTEEEKNLINEAYLKINENDNIAETYKKLKTIINRLWEKDVTDIYKYNYNNDFCFICTNNQFLDEKHESILLTKNMLNRTDDYSKFQIGFICEFKNNNILYVTENEDIMTVKFNDMSNLKTPKQIEQEFINFRVSNKIALNGYVTKIIAVYFINDGNTIKHKKAVELSNQYKLPLIILKKDN